MSKCECTLEMCPVTCITHQTMCSWCKAKKEDQNLQKALNTLTRVKTFLEHAIDMEHLTPGGSTEAWAKDLVRSIKELT